METLHQVLTEDPVPPGQLRSKLPKDLERICLKCLEKEPRKRYGTALEPFLDQGCLRRDGAQLRLTRRGMLLANEVMAVFV